MTNPNPNNQPEQLQTGLLANALDPSSPAASKMLYRICPTELN